jgi:predicted choloylglycine hydrolase
MHRLERIEVSGSHFDVGLAIGEQFAAQIHRALDGYAFLHRHVLPFHRSAEGRARYQQFLDLNQERYPGYVAELEGIAQGAGRPFEEIFLVNLRGEYRDLSHGRRRGCFDCALVSDEAALIGHNEDASPAFRSHTYLVRAQVSGKPAFTALSYPGFLCGNAFGFNTEGVCFSIDNVRPRQARVGVARHFIARSLLEARSLDEAIKRVTVPGRAAGFSYTIGSAAQTRSHASAPRIVHVEVAPQTHHVREVHGCYVHANHYRELDGVEQIIEPSSAARVERAEAILQENAPVDAAGVLAILGDQADERYPIHRTATPPDKLATLCTALFELDARRLRIYTGHPTQDPSQFVEFNL